MSAMRSQAAGRRQSGVALITAILVVALASIAAAAILASANLAVHRTATMQDTERGWWYVDGIEHWVKAALVQDLRDNPELDYLGELWAKPVDYLPVDEGALRGSLTDLQGRFNLNNLYGEPDSPQVRKAKRQFERLLQNIEGADQYLGEGIADAVVDWLDLDQNPQPFSGAEDDAYLGLAPPYRTANRLMASPTELLAVRGMRKELFRLLRDYVTALPVAPTKVNVNTAPPAVLYALSPTQPSAELRRFLETRQETPAQTVGEALTLFPNGPGEDNVSEDDVAVGTEFFLLRSEAFIGNSRVALYSVIHRPQSGLPAIVARSQDPE